MFKKTLNAYMINTIVTGPIQTIIVGIALYSASKSLLGAYVLLLLLLNMCKLAIAYTTALSFKDMAILVKRNID